MSDTRTSTLKAAIALIITSGMMAGCGGGGGGDGSTTAAESVKAQSIFAEPSGALCAKKVSGICSEPTSSGATMAQLVAALNDPEGPQVQLTRYGLGMTSHIKYLRDETGQGGLNIYEEGAASYDSSSKSLVMGGQRIVMEGKTYTFDPTTLPVGYMFYKADVHNGIYVPIPDPEDEQINISQGNANAISVAEGTNHHELTVDSQSWYSGFGLLTDRTDVIVPDDHTIRYQGTVTFTGGDGSPVGGSKYLNTTSVECPINLALDTSSGKLAATTAACTDAHGATLNFTLGDLYIKDSRVSSTTGSEASASASGPATEYDANAPTVTVAFNSNKIGGAIYGRNAHFLVLVGSGAAGSFTLGAERQ